MYASIKDLKYIRNDSKISNLIYRLNSEDDAQCNKLTNWLYNGIADSANVTDDQLFYVEGKIEMFGDYDYYLLSDSEKKVAYLIREDNVDIVYEPQDVLESYGFKKLIRNGDKTILIDENNNKFMTSRHADDKDDPEKALMMVLLKSQGFAVKDLEAMLELIKD
mgnify:CR=1 FL=1